MPIIVESRILDQYGRSFEHKEPTQQERNATRKRVLVNEARNIGYTNLGQGHYSRSLESGEPVWVENSELSDDMLALSWRIHRKEFLKDKGLRVH